MRVSACVSCSEVGVTASHLRVLMFSTQEQRVQPRAACCCASVISNLRIVSAMLVGTRHLTQRLQGPRANAPAKQSADEAPGPCDRRRSGQV